MKLVQKLKIRLHSQKKTFNLKTIFSQLQVTNKTQTSRQKGQRSPVQPLTNDLPVQTVDTLALHHSLTPLLPLQTTTQLIFTKWDLHHSQKKKRSTQLKNKQGLPNLALPSHLPPKILEKPRLQPQPRVDTI